MVKHAVLSETNNFGTYFNKTLELNWKSLKVGYLL